MKDIRDDYFLSRHLSNPPHRRTEDFFWLNAHSPIQFRLIFWCDKQSIHQTPSWIETSFLILILISHTDWRYHKTCACVHNLVKESTSVSVLGGERVDAPALPNNWGFQQWPCILCEFWTSWMRSRNSVLCVCAVELSWINAILYRH